MNVVVNTIYKSVAIGQPTRKLLLLFLIVFVILILWAEQWAAKREFQKQAEAIYSALEIHSMGLRLDAAKFSALPHTAALQPDVLSALKSDDPVLIQRANKYFEEVNDHAGSDALYLMNTKGMTVAASNWNNPKSFVGHNYANRPYFIDAMNGKIGLFYGIGQTTSIPGLFIAAPVYQGETVMGVVVTKVSLRDIESAWAKANTPIMVSDARGIFFLGSVADWKFQSKHRLNADELEWIRRHKQYGDRQNFPLVPWSIERMEGNSGYLVHTKLYGRTEQYLAFDKTLPELGWTITVMNDYAPVVWARVITLILGTLGTGLLVFGGLYWRLREKRLKEQSSAREQLEVRVIERTQELLEAHAFQKSMENSLLVGMRARDLEGRIIYVNAALCNMTGYNSKELIGRMPPYPYWHPDDLSRHWSDNKTALSGQAALKGFESRIKHRDGHDVFTMVYTAPLIDATGKQKGWMSSVVDITEQKKAESKQRMQDAQLQHTARLASMGEMASTLAHELNQPLMALSNFASAARAFAEQGNQLLLINNLQEITMQAQRSADIVRRIRGFVKPLSAGVEQCDVNTVVTNVIALLQPEINRQQTRLVMNLTDSLPAISGDHILLEQVVLNLVMNSLQAMQNTPIEQRLIEVETLLLDNSVCIRVTDCGPGITTDIAAKMFEAFFTTRTEGLGLGLNICRTIVESHHGELVFENRPNHLSQGAVFTLKFQPKI